MEEVGVVLDGHLGRLRHAGRATVVGRPGGVGVADPLGVGQRLAGPTAADHVSGPATGAEEVHRCHGELERGAALDEERVDVVRNVVEPPEAVEGIVVDGLVLGTAVTELDHRHAGAVVLDQLGAQLPDHLGGKGAGTGAEVVGSGHDGTSQRREGFWCSREVNLVAATAIPDQFGRMVPRRSAADVSNRTPEGHTGPVHEPSTPLRAKVVTVSDGVVAGTREDRSGDALAARLVEAGWEVVDRRQVADGVESVAATLTELADGFVGLIVTTGGTGFGPRDLTPEGTVAVVDRQAPGLAEAMRTANPDGLGRLSRAVAGTRGAALILNTPGSTRGTVETLDAVLDVLGHAVDLLAGNRPH